MSEPRKTVENCANCHNPLLGFGPEDVLDSVLSTVPRCQVSDEENRKFGEIRWCKSLQHGL